MVRFTSAAGAGDAPDNPDGSIAAVTYLPGAGPAAALPAGIDDAPIDEPDEPDDTDDARERAEKVLLHRLRGRSLSTAECYQVLRGLDLDAGTVEEIIESFRALQYIDEIKLADQIVHSHNERKGLGRTGVEAEMRRRKIDPSVMLDKLEELPDDEEERAIELATKRIEQMGRLDDQTIDRRLTGFLMRKGYNSPLVRVAVKAALASRGGGSGAVRFR